MPTGYTHSLEKMKYDVKTWLKTNVVRAMGVCVTLRDSPDMTAKEILKSLKNETEDSYHAKKLKELVADSKSLKDPTNGHVSKARYINEQSQARDSYAARIKEHKEKSKKHLESIDAVSTLLHKAGQGKANEVTIGTLEFAMSQLKSAYDFDYKHEPYKEAILMQEFDEWLAAKIKNTDRDILYHENELAKEQARNVDRYTQYKEFIEFIDNQKIDGGAK
jgi:hypothetical protein